MYLHKVSEILVHEVYELTANLYEKDNSMKQDPPPETLQDGHKKPRSFSLLLSFQLCSPVAESAKYWL